MSTHQIFAEKTASISDVRKNVNQYFIDEPVAVLSNNKTKGYMLSAELFEKMMMIISAQSCDSTFRPASARLEVIAHMSEDILLRLNEDELGEFVE